MIDIHHGSALARLHTVLYLSLMWTCSVQSAAQMVPIKNGESAHIRALRAQTHQQQHTETYTLATRHNLHVNVHALQHT